MTEPFCLPTALLLLNSQFCFIYKQSLKSLFNGIEILMLVDNKVMFIYVLIKQTVLLFSSTASHSK